MSKNKLIIIIAGVVCCLTIVVSILILGNGTLYNRYKCPDHTYKLENKRCTKTEIVDTHQKLICPSGYEVDGDTCVKTTVVASKIYYTCNKGYTLDNQTCIKKTVTGRSDIYKCTGKNTPVAGDETKCLKYSTPLTKKVGTETVKYCSTGTLQNDSCVTTVNASKTKGCPNGYEKTANNTCTKTEKEQAAINRTCDKGYTLDGIRCVNTSVTSGTYEEVCNMGYTMKDGKCYRNINIVATKAGIF